MSDKSEAKGKVPFRFSYWADPGKVIAGCCPGSMGEVPLAQQIANLSDAGVTLVINLMEASEIELYQRLFQSYEPLLTAFSQGQKKPIRVEHFPIKDRSIPTKELMVEIQKTIRAEVEAGGIVYVHCMGGIGRTGTVIGCYFVEQGEVKPLEKLRFLTESEKEHFWPTPQTNEQRDFVLDWKP